MFPKATPSGMLFETEDDPPVRVQDWELRSPSSCTACLSVAVGGVERFHAEHVQQDDFWLASSIGRPCPGEKKRLRQIIKQNDFWLASSIGSPCPGEKKRLRQIIKDSGGRAMTFGCSRAAPDTSVFNTMMTFLDVRIVVTPNMSSLPPSFADRQPLHVFAGGRMVFAVK